MSKLIRTKSDVLSLILKAEYLNELAKAAPPALRPADEPKLPLRIVDED